MKNKVLPFIKKYPMSILLALLVRILVRFTQYVHIFTYKYLKWSVYFLLSKFFKTLAVVRLLGMPSSGLEPETSPLPRECSTAELQGQFFKWAGLDLNQRRQSQRIYSPPPLTTRAPTPTI